MTWARHYYANDNSTSATAFRLWIEVKLRQKCARANSSVRSAYCMHARLPSSTKAYFVQVRDESRDPDVRELAAELALDEEAYIAWVKDALAHHAPDARQCGAARNIY